MRFLRKILAAASLSLIAAGVSASPADPQNGVDYLTLEKSQPAEASSKVEVLEFFGYFCPHCNAFEPSLSAWTKKLGNNVSFKRVPVAFNDKMVPQQRMYYALEAMGKLEDVHSKVFHAIHAERQPVFTEAEITNFIAKQGIDKKAFSDMYNSFAVQSKARRATQLQAAYKIDGVPTFVVDGHYVTAPSIVGTGAKQNLPENVLQEGTLKVLDFLIVKAGKEHKAAK